MGDFGLVYILCSGKKKKKKLCRTREWREFVEPRDRRPHQSYGVSVGPTTFLLCK